MIQLIRDSLSHQYGASLKMLDRCITTCKPDHWEEPVGQFPAWHVAYHVLYYTDFYLSKDEESFVPPEFHRKDYQVMGSQPWPPYKKIVADQPYDHDTIRTYIRHCAGKVVLTVARETEATLAGPSGFKWLTFPRLEAHLYNIRHIQHHTGQLAAFIRRVQPKGIGWVGSIDPAELGT